MDRLVKPDVKELNLVFTKGHKSSATFHLTNLMHTMSVAVSLTTTNSSLFSLSHHFSLLQPLSTTAFTLRVSQSRQDPPLCSPSDAVTVRSSMLLPGKSYQEDLRRLFSKPGNRIFNDAVIPICFVGSDVVEFLLYTSPKSLEVNFLLPKAIAFCDKPQLTSLLQLAVKCGDDGAYFASVLVDAGADVNGRDSDGKSMMSLAVRSGNLDTVQLLIDSGYEIDNLADKLLLHSAAAIDRVDMMEILCLGYVDIDLNSVDSGGRTPLHIAAIHGHVEVIQFLVTVGCETDVADSDGWTPLHFASASGNSEAVEILLSNSLYTKYALTKEGKSAFAVAVEKGHSQLYDALHLGDVLLRSTRVGDIHGIKGCLAEGANVNGRDQNGWTPLHRAAFKGQVESIKLLLSHGAQVDAVDDDGYTPHHWAIEAGHFQAAVCLTEDGDKAGKTALKEETMMMMANLNLNPVDMDCFRNHPSVAALPVCEERGRA